MQIIAYHGSPFVFTNFSNIQQNDDLGFFFTESEDDAKCYGDNIILAEITIDTPYQIKAKDLFIGLNEINETISPWAIGMDNLMSQGYDGVVIVGDEDAYKATGEYEALYTQYIVFDSNNIRMLNC